jgi:hypothetical protein
MLFRTHHDRTKVLIRQFGNGLKMPILDKCG